MHAKFVTEHALHIHARYSADRNVIDYGSAEIDSSAHRPAGPPANRWEHFTKHDSDKEQCAQSHRHLARFCRIIESRDEPAITRGFKHCQVIGNDPPTGRLREHINIPVTPAQLAIDEEPKRAQCCRKHHADRRGVFTKPRQGLAPTVPSLPESRSHHPKTSTDHSNDPRRVHHATVQRCPPSTATAIPASAQGHAPGCRQNTRSRRA